MEKAVTSEQGGQREALFCYAGFFIVILSLLPWLSHYLQLVVGVDVAYLSNSAAYFLDGKRMSEYYYDTNPPLSILIYIPNIILQKYLGVSLHHATAIYTLCILLFSLVASLFVLRKVDNIRKDEIAVLLAAFVVVSTVMPQYDFGQKDHFLSMALLPMILVQYAITQKVSLNTFVKIGILIVCSVFILLKPHFGLVPATLFVHRAIVQRRLSVCFDIDFVILASVTLSYLGIIFLYFDDFIWIILKDALKYYAVYAHPDIVPLSLSLCVLSVSVFLIAKYAVKETSEITGFLLCVSLICIIPYYLQGKGWVYHRLPYTAIAMPAIMVVVYHCAGKLVALFEIKAGARVMQGIIWYLSIVLLMSTALKNMAEIPTEESYENSEIVRVVQECGEECNNFFLFHDLINISHETSVYTGKAHASRFPVLWFIRYLVYAQWLLDNGYSPALSQKEIEDAWSKYLPLVVRDFVRHQPDILFIGHVTFGDAGLPEYKHKFNFEKSIVMQSPEFEKLWEDYEIVDILYVDRRKYIFHLDDREHMMRFDVYRKIPE